MEFALSIGIPVTALVLLHWTRASRRIWRGSWKPVDALGLSTAVTLLLLAFLGKTVAETARLWLFLVPLLVVFAGSEVSLRLRWNRPVVLYGLLFLQLGSTLVLKMFYR